MKKLLVLMSVFLIGCSSHQLKHPQVNEENYQIVSIDKREQHYDLYNEPYRFWGDMRPVHLNDENLALFRQSNKAGTFKVFGENLNILVLSGGGERGAYGIGILNGLYDTGELPEFSIITGVSAGALIAPFAYIGDKESLLRVKTVILSLNDKEDFNKRSIFWPIRNNAMTVGDKFFSRIESIYDKVLIEKLAVEYNKGRRLLIGTTHFESGRQMVWNLGRIAASDLPNKEHLIHQVLAASASIPGVFPPQLITVYDKQGNPFQEMHFDGGLAAQLFFNPFGLNQEKISKMFGLDTTPNMYIVRNGYLQAEFKQVKPDILPIAARSLDSLIYAQTKGDLYHELYISACNHIYSHLTYIGNDFTVEADQNMFFDPVYMEKLYDYGYQRVLDNNVWTRQFDGTKAGSCESLHQPTEFIDRVNTQAN
ncbi:patatin-like phospholipase family protein [Vibrio sp. SS-MA-C1-2]|uniref:patatin-like phospholipase family protein n=1 Tax=Vibrio sp. SS-MA-C1-2 TaxID=2908646 RepID=UPI001F46DF0E|nr:patatin-like phospholipase family protein [Vibrio sp. SS-MA-C1-2]UJF17606.1 patatin-like phospholipase family protein [Vibrio sp. SS-MA-C1-2]